MRRFEVPVAELSTGWRMRLTLAVPGLLVGFSRERMRVRKGTMTKADAPQKPKETTTQPSWDYCWYQVERWGITLFRNQSSVDSEQNSVWWSRPKKLGRLQPNPCGICSICTWRTGPCWSMLTSSCWMSLRTTWTRMVGWQDGWWIWWVVGFTVLVLWCRRNLSGIVGWWLFFHISDLPAYYHYVTCHLFIYKFPCLLRKSSLTLWYFFFSIRICVLPAVIIFLILTSHSACQQIAFDQHPFYFSHFCLNWFFIQTSCNHQGADFCMLQALKSGANSFFRIPKRARSWKGIRRLVGRLLVATDQVFSHGGKLKSFFSRKEV